MTKTEKDIENINKLLEKFNLSVTDYVQGTRINQYKIKLTADIDVNKLLRLKKNFIIALNDNDIILTQDGADLVIQTKGDGKILTMDDVFFKSMYYPTDDMRLVLGKDIDGNVTITSLKKAPHILVSGTTGSGKTQLLHSFIASLLLGNKCLHMILIDPKGNEFNVYKDIDTVTFIDDVNDANQVLKWLADLMDSRYKYMAEKGYSDAADGIANRDPKLVRTVCIIDEFADLIGRDRRIEEYVVRLAQKARGCGIHLIIGTQYPKTDVITGLMQANLPTRVCLKVKSNVQSRVALEHSGGEKLLGHGDLLFLGNGMYEPIRIQAPYMSMDNKLKVARIAKERFQGMGGFAAAEPDFYKGCDSEWDRAVQWYREQIEKEEVSKTNVKKHVGIIQGIKNLLNAPQNITYFDMLAMRTSRRSRK